MKRSWSSQLYKCILYLYPDRFKLEFAEEMQAVFDQVLDEAGKGGWVGEIQLILKEIGCLLRTALNQRWCDTRDDILHPTAGVTEVDVPPLRKEIVLALLVFAIPIVNVWFKTSSDISIGLLAATACILFLAGLLKGFPRWSLPSFGLALSALSFVFLFQWVTDRLTPTFLYELIPVTQSASNQVIVSALWSGLMWFSLFTFTITIIGLMALIQRFRGFFWRVRNDWTLVSYILYSGAFFTLVMTFDQYHDERTYAAASLLCLATGACLYMLSKRQWQRTMSLLSGLTLAIAIVILNQWSLIPSPEGKYWFIWTSSTSTAWLETRRLLFEWGWMVAILLAPIWLRSLPSPDRRSRLRL
jgi:hypothetical protein